MMFGERLRSLRTEASLTQAVLAKKCRVHISTLRQWEQGKREPKWSHLYDLTEALGVPADAFKGCKGSHESRSKQKINKTRKMQHGKDRA